MGCGKEAHGGVAVAGRGELRRPPEGGVEAGRPWIDAERVLDEEADVPGADAGTDLDHDAPAVGRQHYLGVRGAVVDADRSDGQIYLVEYGFCRARRQCRRKSVAELGTVGAFSNDLVGHAEVRARTALGD